MIICRKIETCGEKEQLKEILRYYKIKDSSDRNSIIYIIEENDRIIGGSSILLYDDIGILEYLVIEGSKTGSDLGDGLLRSILNYCKLNGLKRVLYPSQDLYLLKKGFICNYNESNSNSLDERVNKYKLVCHIDDFFNNSCKHERNIKNV